MNRANNEREIGKLMSAYKISKQQAVILFYLASETLLTYGDFAAANAKYNFSVSKTALKTQICRIRKKIPAKIKIKIVPNFGYAMESGQSEIKSILGNKND